MNKNKHIPLLSSAAIGTLIATALSTTAYATTDAILTQNKDKTKTYEYLYKDLEQAAKDKMVDPEFQSILFEKYSNQDVIAIHDTVNGYIKYQSIELAAQEALVNDENFDLDEFTEKKVIEKDKINKPEGTVKVVVKEDGNIEEIPENVKENLKVESVSAINETSVQVTGLSNEVTEDALKDSKITVKAGEENLTATYVTGSLTEGRANFLLGNEKRLSDAVTYTVESESFKFAKNTFVAKVKAAYVAKVEVSTQVIPANTAASNLNLVRFTAKDQYGEDITLNGNVGNIKVDGTINGVPLLEDELKGETSLQNGIVEVNKDLKEGDKVTLILTNKINDKDVEVGTVSYTVVKAEVPVATTISNMKATYKAEHGHQVADKFDNVLPDDQVDLNVDVNDQFGNPMVAGTQVRWVVEEGKELITKVAGDAIQEVSDAATFSFKAIKAGKLKISAYNVSNGTKQTFETVIGANKLTALNLANEAGAGSYNKDENIVKVVTPNPGANLTADQIKFDVKASKTTVDVTPADVQVSAKVRGGEKDNKNDIVIVVKTDKPGKYTITPYVGESLEKSTAHGQSFDLTTTVDQTVASIDDINFDAAELKVGSEIKKDITFKNKHGEVVVVDGVKVKVTPDIADAANNAKVTTEVENGVSKNVLTLKVNAVDGAKTYNVVVNKDDIFKTYNLKVVGSEFTSINAGADVTGVVAGDAEAKAKYQEVKFLDQDGKAMAIKKQDLKVSVTKPDGQDLGDGNLAKLMTLGKTYNVDEHGVVNFEVATEGDNVIACKISPLGELTQGTYTVKIADKENKISDTFTVTVGAKRAAKTVEATAAATNVALNGKTELNIVPKDQYGDFIAVGTDKIEAKVGENFKVGAVTEVQDDKHAIVGYKAEVTGIAKGSSEVVVNVKDNEKVLATNKVNMTVDSVAGLINSVEIDKEGIQPAYSTENLNTKVNLKAIAKDAKGQVVPVDASKDLVWKIKSVEGKVLEQEAKVDNVGQVNEHTGEFTPAKNFNGTVTIEVLTANMKSAEITLTCNSSAPAAQKGTTNVEANVAKKVLDGNKDKEGIQVLLDGKDADGEKDGAVVVKVAAKDQFGKDFTKTDITNANTKVMVDDSSVVDAKIDDVSHTITLTSKAKGTANVNVMYNGDTVKLEVSVNEEAAKAAAAKAEADNLAKATQEAKEALNTAITKAKQGKDAVKEGVSADQVDEKTDFVLKADKDDYNTVITEVEAIKDNGKSTKKEFEDALVKLNTATETFNGKKQKGTKKAAPGQSSKKAITNTTVGTLDSGNIKDVPSKTKVSALKKALTVSEKASVEIITGAGADAVADQDNTEVTAAMKIKVTAQDGSSTEYTIAMQA